ncbi:MAG: M20/M25/M40 family metallo-hydrolase [Minicystis sp.]
MSPLSPRVRALAALAVLILAALAGQAWTRPPAPVPASAPATEFSSARALVHLAEIARRPHRMGSPEHARVRAYLVDQLRKLGFVTAIQETTVQRSGRGAPRFATVRNITGTRRGTGGGWALLVMAHYDTRSMTPGASDDGYGVAAVLEAMRAITAGPPLARDLMVLFTDGEEEGLLGARAFVEQHPLAAEVGLVLNFEARGNSGPALMFQTSNDNGGLIRALAEAVPLPAANSLSQDVYRRMPNDTDLTVWLEASKKPAINVANIGGFARYHAPTDTVENVDQATLQHHGTYALALVRTLGSRLLPPPQEPDRAYFDAGPVFIHYPGSWTFPLALAAHGLFVIFVVIGLLRRSIHLGRLAVAFFTVLAVVVLSAVIAAVLWLLVAAVHRDYALINAARPLVKTLYLAAFVTIAITMALGAQALSAHRLRPGELFAGAAAVSCALAVAAALYLPGGAFLFTWPAILALVIAIVLLVTGGFESDAPLAFALQLVLPIPAIVIVSPFILQLWDAFGPRAALAPAAVAALLAAGALPALRHLHGPGVRPHRLTLVVALALVVGAGVIPPFDADHPRPDTLFFAVDADTGRSYWVSPDRAPDDWTSNVLAHAKVHGDVPVPFTVAEDRELLVAEVGKVAEPAPEIRWLDDKRVVVIPPAGAEVLAVRAAGGTITRVNGRAASARSIDFYAPPLHGVELEIGRAEGAKITVHALSQRPGFPDAASPHPGNRPTGFMAKPGMMPPWEVFLESDMTIVARTSTR